MLEQRITITAIAGRRLDVSARLLTSEGVFSPPDAEFAVRLLFEAHSQAGAPPLFGLDDAITYEPVPPSAQEAIEQVTRGPVRNWTPDVPLADAVDVALARGDEGALPVTTYTIDVRHPSLLAPLRVGMEWISEASSDQPTEEVFRPRPVWSPLRKRAWDVPLAARVVIGQLQGAVPNGGARRGFVRESRDIGHVPAHWYWYGSSRAYAVELDIGGPRVWAFSEDLAEPPDDTYEAAVRAPRAFVEALLAEPPFTRAARLREWMLQEGGSVHVALEDGRIFPMCSHGGILFSVLRKLPFGLAFSASVELVSGWAHDTAHRDLRYGVQIDGTGLTEGQSAFGYTWQYRCPLEVTLSDLALLVLEEHERRPIARLDARADAADVAKLRSALETLATLWMGNDPVLHAWRAGAFLESILTAPPGRIPANFRQGYEPARAEAADVGLEPGVLAPRLGILLV